jgi:hypothetical protein
MLDAVNAITAAITAPSAAKAADYERQSDALKACFKQADSSACMINTGWKFCRRCAIFGAMLGGECGHEENGPYRPACWYWHEGPEPDAMLALMVR